jgi:glycosyltransferase involved in cell wall biosynthesis
MGPGLAAPLRLLQALPQFPHDPAAGAARTATTISEMLAARGAAVCSLGTTGTEGAHSTPVANALARFGATADATTQHGARLYRYVRRGVAHALVDIGDTGMSAWRALFGSAYAQQFLHLLATFRPNVVLTYGGHADDLALQAEAREAGARVVFGLFNAGYHSRSSFAQTSRVLTPSQFLRDLYLRRLDLDSTPLPTPLDLDDVVAPGRQPLCVTMVNPTIGKGAMFLVRLIDELRAHPAVPLEVFEARGDRQLLVMAGLAGGFDIRRHPNLAWRDTVEDPREVYARCRLLLVPSVLEEASARVVAEALVNGIPVLASERGGLPENCGDGGLVLPLPASLTPLTRRPVAAADVQEWISTIVAYFRDEARYQGACARARASSSRFDPGAVAEQYVRFFLDVLRS